MDMSKAALPPWRGRYSEKDVKDVLFPQYRQYLNFCAIKMINSSDFKDWKYQKRQAEISDEWGRHPQYQEFLAWMRGTKAGGRKCLPSKDLPNGLAFPSNFQYWLNGGRW